MRSTRWMGAAIVLALIAPGAMARPISASDAMKAAARTAKAQKKAILVIFGASW